MSQKPEAKHPGEYNYLGNEKIEITVQEFQAIARVVDFVLDQETDRKYVDKYHYVNRETSEVIKKITEKNKHLAEKVFDLQKTQNSEPVISRTPLGMEALSMKFLIQGIHMRNIDNGVAKHMSELETLIKGGGQPTQETAPEAESNEGVTGSEEETN